MIRALVLLAVVCWILALTTRLTRTLGRPRTRPVTVRGAEPPTAAPHPDGWLVATTKVVIGLLLVLVVATALLLATGLPALGVVLGVAPVAGLVSSLITDRWLTTTDA